MADYCEGKGGIEITPCNAKPPVRISPASEPKPLSHEGSGALAAGGGDRVKPTSSEDRGWYQKGAGIRWSK